MKWVFVVFFLLFSGVFLNGICEDTITPKPQANGSYDTEMARAARERSVFMAWYKKYRCKYACIDGKYEKLPNFDLRYKNSRGNEPYPPPRKRANNVRVKVKGRFLSVTEQAAYFARQDEEKKRKWYIELPSWKVGHFGYVQYMKVKQVLGPYKMLAYCTNHYSIGAYSNRKRWGNGETVYVTGWPTSKLIDGQEIKDVWLAIIGTYRYETTEGGSKQVLHAIPLAQVRKGLTQQQCKEHLEQEGVIKDGHIQDRYLK